nr:AI-2E family transporter [Brevibacterium daeguense]
MGIAGLAYTLHFFQGLQDIIAPVFLAINLVIVAYPLQGWLVAHRTPRFIAAMVTVVVVLIVIVAFFGLTAWSIAELIMVIPDYVDELTRTYTDILAWLSTVGVTSGVIEEQLASFDVGTIFSTLAPVLSNASLVVSLLVTVVMAVFFVAVDSMSFPRRLDLTSRVRPRFATAMHTFAQGVRRYWVVATIFGLIVAVLDIAALWIIGVPMALVWGVLAFLTNYIPNVGFLIGLIPPAIMALIDSGWWDAFWVVAAYSVLNFIIQSIIQPKFTGESVGVTPFMSFLSLLFWYWVLGWMGALLALPATLLLKALLVDADPKARWINNLIASDLSTGSGLPVTRYRRRTLEPSRAVVFSSGLGRDSDAATSDPSADVTATGPAAVGPAVSDDATAVSPAASDATAPGQAARGAEGDARTL